MTNSNDKVKDINVGLTVEVGKTTLTIGELQSLQEGSILPINSLGDEQFLLKVGHRAFAKGIVEEVEEQLKFTIKEIL